MAIYLYRLARASWRHRRLVIGIWLIVLVGFGIGGTLLKTPETNTFTIPGVDAQKASDLVQQRFPSASPNGASGQVLFEAPAGGTMSDPATKAAVEASVSALGSLPGVLSASDPYADGTVTSSGGAALSTVTYKAQPSEITAPQRTALQQAPEPARAAGLAVSIGGSAVQAQFKAGSTEAVGVLIGAVVLAITFGSFVAAGLPLLTALVGVGVGLTGLFGVSHWVTLSSTAPILALMLGLAVGIDYALFIISRYRRELLRGVEPEEAVGTAVGTAGSAVVFAGLTVLIALAGLSVVGIPFLTVMGLAAAATVLIAVLIALTLLPALLSLCGTKVIGARIPGVRRRPDYDDTSDDTAAPMGERWGRFVVRRRVPVLIVAVLVLAVIAIPFFHMRTTLPDNSTAAPGSGPRVTYDRIADDFGVGYNGPLTVVVTGDPEQTAAGVAALSTELQGLHDVVSVSSPVLNEAKDTAIINAVPDSAPTSSATSDLVKSVRALSAGLHRTTGARVYVTGATAMNIDVSDTLTGALPIYLVIVIGLALVLLLIVFRSVLVPLKATLGFLLTIGSTFGAVVAVFQWGWLSGLIGVSQAGPIISFLPIIMIAILFGLSMDYEVFLVSGMREEHVHGAQPEASVIGGFRHGARVVTAAGIIMISVFAGFVLGDDPTIKSIGFALAFGVLVDAFVVRMTIVPAVMSLLGRAAWWLPARLDRVLPDIDVEGHSLAAHVAARQSVPAAEGTTV